MRDASYLAIGVAFAIIMAVLVFAFGVANKSAPTLAINNVDAPSDGECATWQQTGFGIEWQACSQASNEILVQTDGGATSSVDILNSISPMSFDVVGAVASLTIDTSGTWTGNAATATTADQLVSGSNCAFGTLAATIAADGTLSCAAVTNQYITDGSVYEPELAAVNSPTDEDCATYEQSNDGFEWQTCYSGTPKTVTAIANLPSTGLSTGLASIATAGTFVDVYCIVSDAGTVATPTIDIRASSSPFSSGTALLTADLGCDDDGETSTSFNQATITADQNLTFSISAVSTTTIDQLYLRVRYTID